MAYEITVKPGIFSEKHFSIDADHLTYDDTQMDCKEITGFAYGSTVTRVEGIKANTQHFFRFIDSSKDELNFSFFGGKYLDESVDQIAQRMHEEIWRAFGSRIMTQAIATISGGGKFTVGNVVFSKEGAFIQHRPFFGKARDVVVPWSQMEAEVYQGTLTIRAGRDSGVSEQMGLADTYNAHVILNILEMVARDKTFVNVLEGK